MLNIKREVNNVWLFFLWNVFINFISVVILNRILVFVKVFECFLVLNNDF